MDLKKNVEMTIKNAEWHKWMDTKNNTHNNYDAKTTTNTVGELMLTILVEHSDHMVMFQGFNRSLTIEYCDNR